MPRPTISDLAEAAGVSVSTVDRVLTGRAQVRRQTAQRVLDAAQRIGFYGTRTIEERMGADLPDVRLGFLLQQSNRPFYRMVAEALEKASADCAIARVHPAIEHMEDISPEAVAERMLKLGRHCDALAVITAEHPVVTQAVQALAEEGVSCFGLISGISAPCGTGYVGLDNWKVGRTAGWAFANICKTPGKLGILVGSHRYRSQELNESGFRSYMREHAPEFELLEPMITFEDKRVARELIGDLIARETDLAGIFISGGGITGALDALRETGVAGRLVTVGYELMRETRAGLIDGTLNFVISHPQEKMAQAAVQAMAQVAISPDRTGDLPTVTLPFDIFTPENI